MRPTFETSHVAGVLLLVVTMAWGAMELAKAGNSTRDPLFRRHLCWVPGDGLKRPDVELITSANHHVTVRLVLVSYRTTRPLDANEIPTACRCGWPSSDSW